MSTLKKLLFLAVLAAVFCALCEPKVAFAQQQQKCEGPSELCAQILDLKSKLDAQKAEKEKATAEKDTATAEKEKATAEKDTVTAESSNTALKTEKKDAENVARMLALAAILAIALKTFVSVLQSWKNFFTTDRQKAWLKVITLMVGFLAFLASNIGFGIPWWQSVILAGGGPGAIMVHELLKLFPVLLGKKKLVEVEKDGDQAEEKPADPA